MWQVTYLLVSFRILFISSLIMVCLGVDLFELILFVISWVILVFTLMFFTKLGDISVIIYSDILSASLLSPGNAIVCMLTCLMVSFKYLDSISFFFFFFFLFWKVDNLSWPFFRFSDSFVRSNLMLKPSSEFFISVIVFVNSRIFILFFFILSFYWYFIFVWHPYHTLVF